MFPLLAIILNAALVALAVYRLRASDKAVSHSESSRRARQNVRTEADALRAR